MHKLVQDKDMILKLGVDFDKKSIIWGLGFSAVSVILQLLEFAANSDPGTSCLSSQPGHFTLKILESLVDYIPLIFGIWVAFQLGGIR
jgi:hypothetical protein